MKKQIIIDCDKVPKIPYNGWTIDKHEKQGKLLWQPEKIELYLSKKQKTGIITGYDLRKELEGKPVLNANVLDFLLEHQDLIPKSWKEDEQKRTRYIFFWGTIFRGSDGYLNVRFLYWFEGRWRWYCYWLDCVWGDQDPAALRAQVVSTLLSESKTSSDHLSFDPLERIATALETIAKVNESATLMAEARIKQETAKAEAEVIRARGVAQANEIIMEKKRKFFEDIGMPNSKQND